MLWYNDDYRKQVLLRMNGIHVSLQSRFPAVTVQSFLTCVLVDGKDLGDQMVDLRSGSFLSEISFFVPDTYVSYED